MASSGAKEAAVAKKPVVGVVPLVDYGRESYWMLPGYFKGLEAAGALPLMLPLTSDEADIEQLLTLCDGLLITGGQDVDPAVYGDESEAARSLTGEVSPERDAMEACLMRVALEKDVPTLGICRGIQSLNAILGGTLWQDVPTQHPSAVEHHGKPPYDVPVHRVEVLPNTPLADLLGTGTLAVNSYHHQAVRMLAPGLSPMAISEDGLVEAVWRPASTFCWAVQWHPEFAYKTDPAAQAIFRAFVSAL